MMTKRLCMRCYISGKVQGVWFRAFAKQGAEKLGINGWAHNLNDGRVEIFACGDEEALEVFSVWLKKGPELAQVTHYTRDNLPWEDYTGFHIL